MSFTDLQTAVMSDRYLLKDRNGKLLESQWEEVAVRVGTAVAEGDEPWVRAAFIEMLRKMYFVPGGRILSAMGAHHDVTPYNCFVLPSPHDSRKGIIESLGQWIEVQSRGGGVGINFSSLRPSGAYVHGVNGTSSGPTNWMELFSVATHRVVQQGGSRRGAAMMILNDDHPDILNFIRAKRTPGILEGANLSVSISEKFMQAVEDNAMWDFRWNDEFYGVIPAQELWQEIIEAAWASGEPGVVFLDRANKASNSWYFEDYVATNPCAEKPMPPWGTCLLGSVNLKMHELHGKPDFEQLEQTSNLATRFLDNIIERAYYPFPEFENHQKTVRQTGIGTMGLADMLADCGVRYGGRQSLDMTEDIFRHIKNSSYIASAFLARDRGSFPQYESDKFMAGEFPKTLSMSAQKAIQDHGIRNCHLLSQAPTGTIAKLAGVTEGIEPYYSPDTYYQNRLGTTFHREAPENVDVFAHDLTPEEHVEMLVATQKHIDSAVSKTVNAPQSHTVEETGKVYQHAWRAGAKSVAYYRDQSRSIQVQTSKTMVDEDLEKQILNSPREAPCDEGLCEVTVS